MLAIGGVSTSGGSGGPTYTDEQVRDVVGAALAAGPNVSIAVDDAGDTITVSASVPAGYSDEQAQDAFAALIAAGTHAGISFAYNDAGNAISATVSAQSWSQITGKPTFATVATSGSYTDLANQPAITPPTRAITAGTGLTGGGDLTADRAFAVSYGTAAGTSAQGNDGRLSDPRTPTDSSVTDAKVATNAAIAETKLALASDAAAGTASRRTLGTGATQAAAGSHNHDAAYATTGHTHTGYATTSHAATHASGGSDAVTPASIGAALGLLPTGSKVANYTASSGELVMVDATSGPITITAPATAAGRTFGVKKTDSSTNTVTVTRAGSDTLGSEAATSIPIKLNDQATHFLANGANWVIPYNHLSLAALDLRFAGAATVPIAVRAAVTANTTALPGEVLSVNATSTAITITPPTSPTTGARVFLVKVDTSTNTVTWSGTVSGDAGGVVLSANGAGATLLYTGTAWLLESTTTAATGRTGTGSAPAAAGSRSGTYDPRTNLYWPTGGALRAIRGHRERAALAASPQLVEMVCAGDSRTAGSNITGGTPTDSWPSLIRARLAAAGIPSAGTGLVMASNAATYDSRIVLGGSWSQQYPYRGWTASGATATFTSDVSGSVVEVYYYSNSGTFTVKVGSGTAQSVTPAGGGPAVAKYQATGQTVTAGTTITVTATSAAGSLIGFCVRNTSGLLIHQVAYGGITSSQLAATGAVTLQGIISYINPSILGVMVGAADPGSSVAAATTAANMTTICQTNNPTPAKFIGVESPFDAQQGAWPPYVSAYYDQADVLGCPLYDLNDAYVTPTLGNTAGLLGSDLVHESLTGEQVKARIVTHLLTA